MVETNTKVALPGLTSPFVSIQDWSSLISKVPNVLASCVEDFDGARETCADSGFRYLHRAFASSNPHEVLARMVIEMVGHESIYLPHLKERSRSPDAAP